MTIPTLSTLPVAPARTDPPATFVTRADAFLAAIVTFQGEMNTSIGAMNTDIAGVNADATAAAASASAAASSATAAANAAGAALWVSGQAYAEGDAAISGVDYQTYRAETNTSGTTDPSADSNWTAISGTFPSQSGNAGKFLSTDGTDPLWGDVSASPTLEAVASGTLANGDTVIINADGTVTAAGLVSTPVPVIGSKVEFEAGTTTHISSCYDTGSNKVIIAYKDGSDGNKVKAIVGTVASGAITFGTPANLDGNQGNFTSIAYDANANKVVVIYHKNTTNDGVAQVGTVSGTSISFGSENVFSSTEINNNAICYDSSANKLIIAWYSPNDTAIKVTAGTISGTNMSFGAVASTAAPSNISIGLVYDANANKSLLCYRGPSNYGHAAVISVSGTTASIETPAPFVSETVSDVTAVYDSSNNKTLIIWRKSSNNYGAGIVATISGTSVTFGTEAVIASETFFSAGASFDTTVNKTIVAYYNNTSGYGKSIQGTISGTSVTFTSPVTFLTASPQSNSPVYDPDSERTIFAFSDLGNSNAGTSLLYSSTTIATNLTSENYIGISDAAYSNGATATIQLVGTVDDAQTSLTAGQSYFVQDNGSIALTPAATPVFAGTAISATKLLIGDRDSYPNQASNSGKFLTTDGSTASWATPAGGSWILLNTYTPSGASTVDITDFSSTYDDYVIVGTLAAASAIPKIRMKIGSSIGTSGYVTTFYDYNSNVSNSAADSIEMGGDIGDGSGSGANKKMSFITYCNNVNDSTFQGIYGQTNNAGGYNMKGLIYSGYFYGNGSDRGILTGLQYYPNSGTYTGTVRIYGIVK